MVKIYKKLRKMLSSSTRASLDRALSQHGEGFRPLFKSTAERLMDFLYLNGKEDVAKIIIAQAANTQNVKTFLQAVLDSAHLVFEFPLPISADALQQMKTDPDFKEQEKQRLIKFYKENNYLKDFAKMHDYKKLIMQLFRENGFCAPKYDLLSVPQNQSATPDEKEYDVLSECFVEQCVIKMLESDSAVLETYRRDYFDEQGNTQNDIFVSFYQLLLTDTHGTTTSTGSKFNFVNLSDDKKEANKYFLTRLINGLFYSLLIISCLIGFTEAFAPYSFATALLSSLGLSFTGLPIFIVGIAGFVGFSGFLVNSILFHGNSFSAFNALFMKSKSRFFYDSTGKRLSNYRVLFNALALSIAFFAAVIITSLSFSFYSMTFPFSIAIFFAVVNVIGWTGVLTTAVMGTLLKGTLTDNIVTDLFKALKNLLWNDSLKNFSWKSPSTYPYLLLFTINLISATAMAFFSVTVVSASFGVFTNAFMGVNAIYLNGMLSKTGVQLVVAAAELGLGTFFVSNVCLIINTIRTYAVNFTIVSFNKFYGWIFKANINSKNTTGHASAYKEYSYRTNAIFIGKILSAGLVGCALANASGFAAGYFNSLPAYNVLLYVSTFLGLPVLITTGVVTAAAFALAIHTASAAAYLLSSIGGNGGAALESCLIGDRMHVYRFLAAVRSLSTEPVAAFAPAGGDLLPPTHGRESSLTYSALAPDPSASPSPRRAAALTVAYTAVPPAADDGADGRPRAHTDAGADDATRAAAALV